MNGARLVRVLAVLLFAVALNVQAKTVAYPTEADARYQIDVPDTWEVESAEEMGGFVNLSGPSGALISLRILPAAEYTLDELMQEAVEFMQQNYTDVKLSEPMHDGSMHRNGAVATSDGTQMALANSWLVGPDVIMEIRIAAEPGDGASVDEGMKILGTLRESGKGRE